jgi:transposase
MIGIEQYQKIQDYRAIGLSRKKTAKVLRITYSTVCKYWDMCKEDYAEEAEQEKYHMDNYRQYILEQLKLCPQIRDTNIYLKLMEVFPELQVKRATFYRYMKALREQHGYQHASKRKTSPREVSPLGYEAQADFGQYKLKDMYGRTVRVYFFCMVLSYSRMKFVYFSPDPFTTKTAIKAHNYAFQYYGGRPQTILYDLDRVYVVSENLGDIIFVPAFEEYVKTIGYSVSLCRPRDPQSKGKVEEVVGYVKHSFLEGRVYTGIDSLNSAALSWLDREGNGRIHTLTRKVPREMFREEQSYLFHVKPYSDVSSTVVAFDSNGVLRYKGNLYQINIGTMNIHHRIRIEDDGEMLLFYDTDTNELLAKYPVIDNTGQVFKSNDTNNTNRVAHSLIKQYFAEHEMAQEFLLQMEKEKPKYFNSHCIRLNRMTKFYTMEQLIDGIRYCIKAERCNAYELLAYLMHQHGEQIAKSFLPNQQYFNHLARSKEIRRKIDGRYN